MAEAAIDGEISKEVETLPAVQSTGMAVALQRAEIDLQITTAKAHPRPPTAQISAAIKEMATLNEHAAIGAVYALPRAGKPVRGPSIRLAEIIKQTWGNCRVESWVVGVDRAEKIVIAKAMFHDLQTNAAESVQESRSIVDRHGRFFSHDMIVLAGKAAAAIARRNVILTGVPEAVWWPAFQAAEQVLAGDIKTLSERRDRAMKAFATFGVKPEQIFAALEVRSLDEITLDHLTTLQGMHQAIKNSDTTVEELFPKERAAPADNWRPPQQQVEPPHDPQTGEIMEDKPSKLELIVTENNVENYLQWGARFIQKIEAAATDVVIDEWNNHNKSMLEEIERENRKVFKRIEEITKMRRAALAAAIEKKQQEAGQESVATNNKNKPSGEGV